MKTIFSVVLMICLSLTASAQTWLTELRKASIIDSIVVAKDDAGWANYLNMSSFQIYYHQPVVHANPDGEQFQLRATLVVRKGATTTSRPMHCFFSGYNIHEYNWTNPSYYVGQGAINNDYFELTDHFKANCLFMEHRYFGGSHPDKGYERMEHCNTAEASADFHALIEAVKTVFNGKYIMSGISKGGTTTFVQHAYYPDDADVYVPYVAPLCNGVEDASVMTYYRKNTWDEELNRYLNEMQREMLLNDEVYKYIRQWNAGKTEEQVRQLFLYNIGVMDFGLHMSKSRAEINTLFDRTNKMKAELMAKGYSEPYLLANMVYYSTLDPDNSWGWLTTNNARVRDGHMDAPKEVETQLKPLPFTIPEQYYEGNVAYYYQSLCELGNAGFDFCSILEDKDADKGKALNEEWRKAGNGVWFTMPYLKGTTYDPALRNKVIESVKHTEKPIIFIYGGDDAWTGGALPDDCYNGYNTVKMILPEQNHGACISNASSEDQARIWQILDDAMNGTLPTDITSVSTESNSTVIYNLQGQKVETMQKGHIYILNGKKIIY